MTAPLIAGLDFGTQSVRAHVFDTRGHVRAAAALPTPVREPAPGLGEHDPEALWRAAAGVLRAAMAKVDAKAVRGIAVASMGESAVPVDAAGQPTHTALAWYDGRTRAQATRITAAVGAERLFAITGQAPDPTFGLCKLLWLRENAPDAFARTRRWLNIADWIAFRLSGEAATDASLASRTLAFDLSARRWSPTVLDALDLDPALFAPLRANGHALGPVTVAAAAATGLSRETIVGVGAHDHVAGALATGARRPGVLLDSIGTAEALFATVRRPLLGDAMRAAGIAQGAMLAGAPCYYLLAGLKAAGGAIEWFRQCVAGGAAHAALIEAAANSPPGARGVLFLAHLRDRPPPRPDPLARAAFIGITAAHRQGDLFRALLEGLAFEARAMHEGMAALGAGEAAEEIRVVGGGVRNTLLLEIKASVYGQALKAAEVAEATSLGAALMGGVAAGLFSDFDEAERGLDLSFREIAPDPSCQALYDAIFRRVYRGLYDSLATAHHLLAEIALFPAERHRPTPPPGYP